MCTQEIDGLCEGGTDGDLWAGSPRQYDVLIWDRKKTMVDKE